MANRYYVVDTTQSPQRWQRIIDGLQPIPGRRDRADTILHSRTSVDGTLRLIEAETDDAEHAWLIGQAGVTYIGGRNPDGTPEQAVYDYLAANQAIWEKPRGA